jgi:hypothetical protein
VIGGQRTRLSCSFEKRVFALGQQPVPKLDGVADAHPTLLAFY